MRNSLTQFMEPFQQKTIEQFFTCKTTKSNQDLYQQIILTLASDISFINEKFVREWIQFTKNLQYQLKELQVKLKRVEILGTKTTYQLVYQDQISLNLQSQQISDTIQNLQQQIEQKKTNIPVLDSKQIETAKIENAQNIQYTEQFLLKLKEYNTVLRNHQFLPKYSFQTQSQYISQNFSDEQNFRLHQQQQQILNLGKFTSQE